MTVKFKFDSRLGIEVPELEVEWEHLHPSTQAFILEKWEEVRGDIPDKIKELETQINLLQEQLNEEEDFFRSCEINSDISELASIINDLWIWYRTGEHVEVKTHS